MASIWDAITGRKSAPAPAPHPSHPSTSPPTDSGDIAPTTTFTSTPAFDTTTSSFLTPAALDPTLLHPLAGLSSTLSYLDLDETALSPLSAASALPSRGWSDDLCYGTGSVYLVGLSTGGLWGLAEGLRRSPAAAPPRLKLNYVLNGMTRRGPFLGNSGGVLALVYNGVNSAIGSVRGKHDTANSVLAGVLSGAVFKSTRGLRPMAWSAVMVGGAAGAWSVGSKAFL
ncbi:Tim17/Tim22/Tim23/Pmp24 family-domain-containing protein [Morchella snyderi]|nr:Tim17/Tim22/Tim23/Pmp24 family-domain-containing protein [Morchella snyderi]